ncbi:ATP-binding cassette domain-containing protein [Klenkia sp. LSe6-5]|uniref:ATP-binding cassette domain-containing protein n=1 Tax=Klenkia sesuvii TaxID=3103137 RepID=A0ABU8DT29_9ACTN
MATVLDPSGGPSPAALDVHDLVVDVGGARLLDGITFSVPPESRTALVGASGSGKSMTAGAVVGRLPLTATATGSVRVAGTEVLGVPAARRRAAGRVAAVAQDPLSALNPLVPIGTQLTMPLRRRAGLRGSAARARARELLLSVGLDDPDRVLGSVAGELSGGQRQRVCTAIALASEASLLVADEPTTALDLVTQAQVVDVLRRHTRSTALLFITHDVAVAAALCDRVVVLEHGRVVEQGPTTELVSAPSSDHLRELVCAARAAA